MIRALVLVQILAAHAAAADCPPAPDIDAHEARVFEMVQDATSELDARALSNELWALWSRAPDEVSQALLDRGMSARASYDFLNAIEAFDKLTEYCPDFAEGYNQRAFVNFLREDFSSALVDLDRAIDLRPTHAAALAGKALTLMGLGLHDEAQDVLREALDLNPWLPERSLLKEPKGEKL